MTERPDQIAGLALAEFRRRQAKARATVAAGAMQAGQAEMALRPWASLAVRAGIDLPELEEATAYWRAAFLGDDRRARATLAATLAVRARCRTAIEAANEKLLARADHAAATQLQRLAVLVAPPMDQAA